MRGAVLHRPRDVRFEEREAPKIVELTDAILRISLTCVCGSDLWPCRRLQPVNGPTPMGHEYCGIVEGVGGAVRSIKPRQFVIGSFTTSDNTCPNCPVWLPVVVHAPQVHHRGARASAARAAGRRDAGADAGRSV
jgi:threonine dehydrogenase-like Zn-dependent dehydrogenase